jgi:tRNA A-37 threonylcarbamoyl transferase component Bud32
MAACPRCAFADAGGLVCGLCGALLPLQVGPLTDRILVEAPLGEGSCGAVYRARQVGIDRPIALKVPRLDGKDDLAARQRFEREARALAAVDHPGVVGVHGVGHLPDGRPYLAMELIEGESLDAVIARAPLGVHRAIRIAAQLASALAAVHRRGLVHRDVKPSNLLLARDHHGDERLVLIDFGVARRAGDVPDEGGGLGASITAAGDMVGTPLYMAPEQVQGEPVAASIDQYGLGVTLFEMLTGRTPFDGGTVEVIVAHLQQVPPAPSALRPALALVPGLDALVARCLAKRAADRFASLDEVRRALLTIADQLDDAPCELAPRRSGRRARWILGAAVMAGAAAGALTLMPREPAAPSLAPAARPGAALPAIVADVPPAAAAPAAAAVLPEALLAGRHVLLSDDGMALRLRLPRVLTIDEPAPLSLELWDEAGEPATVRDVIVTVERPDGVARGLTVPRQAPGTFASTLSWSTAGRYVIRVFPPIGDVTFSATVDVDAAPAA